MKKEYQTPEIEIVKIDFENIALTDSGANGKAALFDFDDEFKQ